MSVMEVVRIGLWKEMPAYKNKILVALIPGHFVRQARASQNEKHATDENIYCFHDALMSS